MYRGATWRNGFKADYERIFVEPWSPYLGAILLVMVILGLMISGLFWGVFGGLKLWGDWFNSTIGLGEALKIKTELDSPLMHRMSLMNITLLSGAFAAALMSRQFGISRAPRLEYAWGALGGTLMGIGATLAGGCTTGGFFTPVLHSSPAGWMMALGLMAGAVIGLKLLLWTLGNISWGMQVPASGESSSRERYPLFGVLVAGVIV
ncbi:MAG TPA: YeeE/YedE thiosulfate transporter family protein, partial [Pseudomonas sp.]|nr:YeeE/YedE thiosulfate transporter family protein [Pseudomonas sp.]